MRADADSQSAIYRAEKEMQEKQAVAENEKKLHLVCTSKRACLCPMDTVHPCVPVHVCDHASTLSLIQPWPPSLLPFFYSLQLKMQAAEREAELGAKLMQDEEALQLSRAQKRLEREALEAGQELDLLGKRIQVGCREERRAGKALRYLLALTCTHLLGKRIEP